MVVEDITAEPLCPRCKERPRKRAESGRLNPYCSPCSSAAVREAKGYAAAERACERCQQPYRGNSRAKARLCPDCRTHCVTCGRPKSAGDKKHSECGACRALGRICTTCGINPTYQNRKECWECLTADGTRAAQIRDRIYSLPPGWFDQKMTEQGGKCRICGQPEKSVNSKTGKAYPLAVDHDRSCCPGDRSCGKCLRGLVCRNHNVMLGMANDDPAILRAAIEYLERHRLISAPAS